MKPKTKIQIRVTGLSAKIKPITQKQKVWAYEKCLDKFCVRSRKTIFCLECGHSWKDEAVLVSAILGCSCPCCGSELKMKTSYNRYYLDAAYFAVLTTCEDMQVVRMFYASKSMKKLKKAEYFVEEVMQHWIDNSGNVTTMSKSVQGLSHYYDKWIFYSPLEVRPRKYQSCPRYSIGPYKIYPERKILPVIKRNGFKGQFYDFTPQHLFSIILRNSFFETLIKTNQVPLLKYFDKHNTIERYWKSIKICIRNNYKIADASIWCDYVDLLAYFGKDLSSTKYVCPDNLKLAHDRFVNKKREEDRKLKLMDLRRKIEVEQEEYEKQKGKFFNIKFSDGEIIVQPLKSVEEFMIEGDTLKHCIFANEYYKRENSLLLSAKINNKSVETIEVSLQSLTVLQARGMENKATKYHKRIVAIVNKNIKNLIAQSA